MKTKVAYVIFNLHVQIVGNTVEEIKESAKKLRNSIGFDTRFRGIPVEVRDDTLIVNLEKICEVEDNN